MYPFITSDGRLQTNVLFLVNGVYVLQKQEPVMPEIGLGIGRGRGTYRAWTREWLYWYDPQGNQLLAPEEVASQALAQLKQEQQRAEQERRLREELSARLNSVETLARRAVCDTVDRHQNRYLRWRSPQYPVAQKSQLRQGLQSLLVSRCIGY